MIQDFVPLEILVFSSMTEVTTNLDGRWKEIGNKNKLPKQGDSKLNQELSRKAKMQKMMRMETKKMMTEFQEPANCAMMNLKAQS